MRPEVEAATQHVAKVYGEQLKACEALIDFAMDVGEPRRGRPLGDQESKNILSADTIIAGLFVRASNTNWAALELCRIGFGEKALMLQRSLFEDLADLAWATVADPQHAVQMFKDHEEQEHLLFGDAAAKYPQIFKTEALPTVDDTRRKELKDKFGSFGDKSWTGLNLHERIEAIEHLWAEGDDREELHFFRRIPHRLNNSALHTTAYALSAIKRKEDDEGISFSIGPTAQGVEAALSNSNWMYTQVLRIALGHFDFPLEDRERLERLYVEGRALFTTLTEDQVRGVGRNDPCPCHSGKKFKHCHGA